LNKVVLDSSAALAVLAREPGADQVIPVLSNSVMSAVNLAEVHSNLVQRGIPEEEARATIFRIIFDFEDFDYRQAAYAGALVAQTKPLGLSLGDRCCLALASRLNAPVYTTDKTWKNLQLGFPIHVIR
jgi:ribonuclease VapC